MPQIMGPNDPTQTIIDSSFCIYAVCANLSSVLRINGHMLPDILQCFSLESDGGGGDP